MGIYLALALLAVVMLGPLTWMLGTSLKSYEEVLKSPADPVPARLVPGNYARVFSQIRSCSTSSTRSRSRSPAAPGRS